MSRPGPLVPLATLLAVLAAAHAAGAQDRSPSASAAVASDAAGSSVQAVLGAEGKRSRSGAARRPGISASGEATVEVSDGESSARAQARDVVLLDGVVSAASVTRSASAASGDVSYDGRVSGLRIGGVRVPGTLTEGRGFSLPGGAGTVGVNVEGAGLIVTLDRATAGLPAGTRLIVAHVGASAPAAAEPPPTREAIPAPRPRATPAPRRREPGEARRDSAPAPSPEPRDGGSADGAAREPGPAAVLTPGRYTFPVLGPSSTSDSFGAPRPGNRSHEGNDVFADFGAPVVAVADGTLEKVGTLPISGNRLWLRTDAGDTFFYAHLSAFSPAAVDGARVRAGTVLGYVGNTGDAETTPPHLHFEIHPGDGPAIDPYALLTAWSAGRDLSPEAPGALGAATPAAGGARPEAAAEPRPGELVPVRDLIAEPAS